MQNQTMSIEENKIQYSKMLSSLFCSSSIIALSVLCLLNNMSLDLYSAAMLLKVVLPASFCFWFIGLIIGKILDKYSDKIITNTHQEEKKAYEIPSIFSDIPSDESEISETTEELWENLI